MSLPILYPYLRTAATEFHLHLIASSAARQIHIHTHTGTTPRRVDRNGSQVNAPQIHCFRRGLNQRHRTEQTRTRIPAAAFWQVPQLYRQDIMMTSFLHIRGDIDVESIITILPLACLRSVHIYLGFRHGSVEIQYNPLGMLIHTELTPVVAPTRPWQTSRAARLLSCLCLAVLLDSNRLAVVVIIERPANRPVVRHSDLLPI